MNTGPVRAIRHIEYGHLCFKGFFFAVYSELTYFFTRGQEDFFSQKNSSTLTDIANLIINATKLPTHMSDSMR